MKNSTYRLNYPEVTTGEDWKTKYPNLASLPVEHRTHTASAHLDHTGRYQFSDGMAQLFALDRQQLDAAIENSTHYWQNAKFFNRENTTRIAYTLKVIFH